MSLFAYILMFVVLGLILSKISANEYYDVGNYDLKNIVNQIYIINLDKDVHKMKTMDKNMKKLGLAYKRIAGVDGKKIYEHYKNITNLNYGQLGCLLSHVAVLKDAIKNNYENILVLEDDVLFHKNFLSEFKKKYESLIGIEKRFDLLYLGCSQKHDWENVIINKDYLKAHKLDGTFAMIINKNIYSKILYHANQLQHPIDRVLYNYIQDTYQAYCLFPYLTTVSINEISNTDDNKLDETYYSRNMINIQNFDNLTSPQKLI